MAKIFFLVSITTLDDRNKESCDKVSEHPVIGYDVNIAASSVMVGF